MSKIHAQCSVGIFLVFDDVRLRIISREKYNPFVSVLAVTWVMMSESPYPNCRMLQPKEDQYVGHIMYVYIGMLFKTATY